MTVQPWTPTEQAPAPWRPELEPPQSQALDIGQWAVNAGQVYKVAEMLAATTFVPAPLRGKPAEVCAAILYGREIGWDPMTSLRAIDVIEGRPTLTANAQRGLAMAKGVKFEVTHLSDERVKMRARAPGDDKWTEVEWTMDRARQQGLAHKSNWKQQPQNMLVARCTSQLFRLVAPNLALGMPYCAEELRDLGPEPEETPAAAAATTRRRRAPVPATVEVPLEPPAPEPGGEAPPPLPEPGAPTVTPDDEGPRLSDGARKAIMARFTANGVEGRLDRLATISRIVGRDVPSVNVLTPAEASAVLSALNGAPADEWPEVRQVPDGPA